PEEIQVVRGFVYNDWNSNGQYEPELGDTPKAFAFVERFRPTGPNTGQAQYYITNANGEYVFFLTEAGSYEFTTLTRPGQVVTQSPTLNLSYDPILGLANPFTNTDIGVGPQVTGGALPIIDLNVFKVRCNELIALDFSITNVGDEPIQSGDLWLTFPQEAVYFASLVQPDFVGNIQIARWDIEDLAPGASVKSRVFLTGFPETETGEEKVFRLRIENSTLQNWEDQQTLNLRTVFCGVDPNDKLVSPAGVGLDNDTHPDSTLTYTIRFQNTGNDYAQNVTIIDTLDPSLDLESFQFLNSSHPVQMSWLAGNVINFSFPGIMLPDSATDWLASQGYVRFQINPVANVSEGTVISNQAAIYFDQNQPIITNTVFNTMNSLITSVDGPDSFRGFSLFPNPAAEQVRLSIDGLSGSYQVRLYNAVGQQLRWLREQTSPELQLATRGLPSGIYFIELENGAFRQTKKLVIQHP
ncbi:MAG: T9SS type A sorting domain-containing protein, partial [Bacteroidota bacterium]